MSDKTILYLYDVCGLSCEAIALQSGLTVDQIRAIVSKPNPYPPAGALAYNARQRYSGWITGK